MTNRRHSKTTEDAKSEPIEINDDDHEETSCGIGSWRPKWLQFFASANFFVINFSIIGILQGAMFTYMIGIMSTIEKRFAFETKVSGFILIADNLSQMVVSPLVGYLGTKYNRSHLIAIGELVVALSCLVNAVPFYMYGPGVHLLNKDIVTNTSSHQFDLCLPDNMENCESGQHSTVMVAVVILWMSSFANGFGYTAFYTIGLPYIDDNIAKKNSPMYLSMISTLRLLGPALGFILSSICLSFYENPFMDPGITRNDPRWIGAWWLGFIILGAKEAFKRLSTNYLLIFHVFGGVFRIIGYLGYYVIKPKYMELQYRQSASSASFFTGATSVATMAVGTMAGGVLIRYIKPSARKIAIFVCLVELISTMGILSAMFLQCDTPQFATVLPIGLDKCDSGCECTTKVFQPVCGSDGVTNYFSPCYAGCQSYDNKLGKFNDCSCLASSGSHLQTETWATNGWCSNDCNKFPIFISILSLCNMIASTARTGDTLITLRSVEKRDKSFAMGVMGSIFAIFAFIPYPMIYGAIIDSTCLVWEKTCGNSGNCWLYDIDKFRVLLHVCTFGFIMIGITLEIGTVIMAGRIKDLYDEDGEDDNGIAIENDKKDKVELKNMDLPALENNHQNDQKDQTEQSAEQTSHS
ncbi:hypothetical protein RDWZM_002005 [Blomia tropicalis]|uniref:Kazal-like domain-containing protein n=1 Tax=Blomia tropicalis TaxID=40697 RepID=A0A9Q0MH50_BLOTA|nr:hypothetical protein RDWZM_002005 [Blomia tropicalis]